MEARAQRPDLARTRKRVCAGDDWRYETLHVVPNRGPQSLKELLLWPSDMVSLLTANSVRAETFGGPGPALQTPRAKVWDIRKNQYGHVRSA